MNLRAFKTLLRKNAEKRLRLLLADGDPIPAAFHITEVGQVTKDFIDCGGTRRTTAACVLQAWVSEEEPDHRLTAGKLATILDLAGKVIPSDDMDMEIEYEHDKTRRTRRHS
jgi:hypothetical protein